jgi:hypothetical protein
VDVSDEFKTLEEAIAVSKWAYKKDVKKKLMLYLVVHLSLTKKRKSIWRI